MAATKITVSTYLHSFLVSSGFSPEHAIEMLESSSASFMTLAKALESVARVAPRYKPDAMDPAMSNKMLKEGPAALFAGLKKRTLTKIAILNPFSLMNSLSKLENGVDIEEDNVNLNTPVGTIGLGRIMPRLRSGITADLSEEVSATLTANGVPHSAPKAICFRVALVVFALYGKVGGKHLTLMANGASLALTDFGIGPVPGNGSPVSTIFGFTSDNGIAARELMKKASKDPLPDGWNPVDYLATFVEQDHFLVASNSEVTFPYKERTNFVATKSTFCATTGGKFSFSRPPFFSAKVDGDGATADALWSKIPNGHDSLLENDFFGVDSLFGSRWAYYTAVWRFCLDKKIDLYADKKIFHDAFAILTQKNNNIGPKVFLTKLEEGVSPATFQKEMKNLLFLVPVPPGRERMCHNCILWFPNSNAFPPTAEKMMKSETAIMVSRHYISSMSLSPFDAKPSLLVRLEAPGGDTVSNLKLLTGGGLYFNSLSRGIFSTYIASCAQGDDLYIGVWKSGLKLDGMPQILADQLRPKSLKTIERSQLDQEFGSMKDVMAFSKTTIGSRSRVVSSRYEPDVPIATPEEQMAAMLASRPRPARKDALTMTGLPVTIPSGFTPPPPFSAPPSFGSLPPAEAFTAPPPKQPTTTGFIPLQANPSPAGAPPFVGPLIRDPRPPKGGKGSKSKRDRTDGPEEEDKAPKASPVVRLATPAPMDTTDGLPDEGA